MIRKVKNWLGIEGVKISLELDAPFDPKATHISGVVILTSQTEQFVKTVNFKLIERYARGRRKSKLIDEYVLGKSSIRVFHLIEADGTRRVPFSMSFETLNSAVDDFGSRNIVNRGLTSVAKWIKNAKSEYFLICEADVKGTRLQPFQKLALN